MADDDAKGEKPGWRWWLFRLTLALHFRYGWSWALRLMGWSVLPQWVGDEGADLSGGTGDVPF